MLIERTCRDSPRRRTTAAILALAALALPGCERRSRHDTAHLAGTVRIDGAGVPQGKLVLLPLGSGQGPAVGATIADGRYDCPRAPVGKVLLQIYANRPTGKVEKVMGAELPEVVDIVPEKYRSGIEIEVFGDDLARDISLRSAVEGDPNIGFGALKEGV